MRRCAVVLVLVAFIFSSGGEWSVLQCVAWANMIREYSQAAPLSDAVQMTFSGEHPCPLCKAIAAKKQRENSKTVALVKVDKPVATLGFALRTREATAALGYYGLPDSFLRFRAEAPPVPPPRLA